MQEKIPIDFAMVLARTVVLGCCPLEWNGIEYILFLNLYLKLEQDAGNVPPQEEFGYDFMEAPMWICRKDMEWVFIPIHKKDDWDEFLQQIKNAIEYDQCDS